MNKFITLLIASSIFSCYAHEPTRTNILLQNAPKESALSDKAILPLAQKQVLEVYTFYFEDIDAWRAKIKKYFSSEGYNNFIETMTKSKIIDSVMRDKLIVQPKVKGEPVLISKGAKKGSFIEIQTWNIEIPLQITYLGPHSKNKQDLVLALEIENKPANKDEIIIQSLKIKEGLDTSME